MVNRALRAALSLAFFLGCIPELDDRSFLVSEGRVLAIQAEPAEAAPGEVVSYRLLWAQPDGGDPSEWDWAHCTLRKPLAELGPVHPGCLSGDPAGLEAIGKGVSVEGSVPKQACRRFGPDLPEPTPDSPSGRPVDPDATGGFYQPVVVHAPSRGAEPWSLGHVRISCGIAGATPDQLARMAREYVRNRNPSVESVQILRGPASETLYPGDPPAGANTFLPGETITLRASWSPCEDAPCDGAEPYLHFDPRTRTIETATESLRLSWFSTDGHLSEDRTGATEGSAGNWSENTWTAPDQEGNVKLWIVIRDDRGGLSWQEYRLRVTADSLPRDLGSTKS